jgi:hypothetical protein
MIGARDMQIQHNAQHEQHQGELHCQVLVIFAPTFLLKPAKQHANSLSTVSISAEQLLRTLAEHMLCKWLLLLHAVAALLYD